MASDVTVMTFPDCSANQYVRADGTCSSPDQQIETVRYLEHHDHMFFLTLLIIAASLLLHAVVIAYRIWRKGK